MFTPCRIAFAPARKQYLIGVLFTHENGNFGAISVTGRGRAVQISKVESHISDIGFHTVPDTFSSRYKKVSGKV